MSLQSCPFLLPAMILSQAWLNVTSQEAEMATCFSDSEDEILDESFSIVPYNIEPVVTDDDDDDESSSADSSHDEDERTSNTTWYSISTSFINTIFILIKVLL